MLDVSPKLKLIEGFVDMCFDLQPIKSNIKQTLIILFSPEFDSELFTN